MSPRIIALIAKLGIQYGPALLVRLFQHKDLVVRFLDAAIPVAKDAAQRGVPYAPQAIEIITAPGDAIATTPVGGRREDAGA